jgi:hypothetical protein
MSRDPQVPVQLRVVGATDLERRLLNAAASDRPSDELTRRMGAALGLSIAASGAAVAEAAPAAQSAAHTTAVASTSGWPALTIGVVAVVAAGVAGVHWVRGRHSERAPIVAARVAAPTAVPPALAPPSPAEANDVARPAAELPRHRRAPVPAAAPPSDLRAEIALIDATRNAVAAHADDRALALIRRYEATYPTGTFRPEATVLRIEALADLGHTSEARALARRFIAAHPDNPLADRVARLAR